ncbi:MAG TPA: tRNA (cytidine(56)-2'-O)-methyltransferase [Thermoplasmata archaeon]|nr:tRNA (cytidine(56)-2'-O)-methyltransferase [Thermoplasmata archaeon]
MRPPRRRRAFPAVDVLRIGHRPGRDPRLTTHLALAARALGADRLLLHPPDPAIAATLAGVSRRFGGKFVVEGVTDWRRAVRARRGEVVHLTMYGEPIARKLPWIRRRARVLLVVGGAKVPADLYAMADANVSVGSQPHSEVAALAVVLDRLVGTPATGRWKGAEQRIVPQARGKRVRTVAPPRP